MIVEVNGKALTDFTGLGLAPHSTAIHDLNTDVRPTVCPISVPQLQLEGHGTYLGALSECHPLGEVPKHESRIWPYENPTCVGSSLLTMVFLWCF